MVGPGCPLNYCGIEEAFAQIEHVWWGRESLESPQSYFLIQALDETKTSQWLGQEDLQSQLDLDLDELRLCLLFPLTNGLGPILVVQHWGALGQCQDFEW